LLISFRQPHSRLSYRKSIFSGALDSNDAKIMRMWLSRNNYRDIESFVG
jgi:hypothetical protein